MRQSGFLREYVGLAGIAMLALVGTAAAAWLGVSAMDEDALADGVLVVHGDLVTERGNLVALLDGFAAQQPLAAALVQELGDENPRDWIVARLDGV